MRARSIFLYLAAVGAVFVSAIPAAQAATASNGLIAYNSYQTGDGDIYVVDPETGNVVNVTGDQPEGEIDDDQGPDWSPDGTRIAFTRYSMEACDIYVINPDGTGLTPIYRSGGTFELPRCASQPDWSPNGQEFAFLSNEDGNLEVYRMNADGTGVTQVTHTTSPSRSVNPAWSPDGTKIVMASDRDGTGQDLYVMNADGSGAVNITNVNNSDVWLWNPAWSPDGKQIAYTRLEYVWNSESLEIRYDIHAIDLASGATVDLTDSAANEAQPAYSPDGTQISFVRHTRVGDEVTSDVWVVAAPTFGTQARAASADGSRARQVTFSGSASQPDWQSVLGRDTIAPISTIVRPEFKATYLASWTPRFSGTALDDVEVAMVEVALGKRLSDGSCRWWNGTRFASTGSCRTKIWLEGNGTTTWTYRLPTALAPSAGARVYTLLSRATDTAGNVESTFERGRNANTFEVAQP